MFEDKVIEIPCPGCGHKNAKTIGWLKNNDSYVCGSCGKPTKVEKEKFMDGLKSVESSIDNLKKSLRKLGSR